MKQHATKRTEGRIGEPDICGNAYEIPSFDTRHVFCGNISPRTLFQMKNIPFSHILKGVLNEKYLFLALLRVSCNLVGTSLHSYVCYTIFTSQKFLILDIGERESHGL